MYWTAGRQYSMYWIQVSVLYSRKAVQHVLDTGQCTVQQEAVMHVLDTGLCTVQQGGSTACTGYRSVHVNYRCLCIFIKFRTENREVGTNWTP